MPDELIVFGSVIAILWCLLAFIFGLVDNEQDNGCKYQSLHDYHPARVVICELARDRWCDESKDLECNK